MKPCLALAMALAMVLAATPAWAFDKVLLKDGRMIEGKLVEASEPEVTLLDLGGVQIPIRSEMVERTYLEDMKDYVPKDEKEKEYLAKGFVRFEDSWMARTRRDQILRERAEAQEAAIDRAIEEQDWHNAKIVETKYFVIKSNCTEEVLDQFADRMDAYFKFFSKFWSIRRSPAQKKEKLKFFLYRDGETYRKLNRMGPGVLGHFQPATEELHLYFDALEPERSLDVLHHEANHLITHLIDPGFNYPRWMHESMAEYFGSAEMDEKGNFTVGYPQWGRIAAMRAAQKAGKAPTPKDVLLTPHQEFTAIHYAVGWSFVHFLMESPKYGKKFKAFFGSLPDNKDVPKTNQPYMHSTKQFVKEADVMAAMEKRLGADIDELVDDWNDWITQAYGEFPAKGYYDAARLAQIYAVDDGSHVDEAFEFFQTAVDKGITNPNCYRRYAEMLRKGGINDGGGSKVYIRRDPDQLAAWDMINRAIDLDPLNAYNYCEAAGILIMDGPVHDLDRAEVMCDTVRALAPDDPVAQSMRRSVQKIIEKTRKNRTLVAEQADLGDWSVQPFYLDGEEAPEALAELNTPDVRELIREGELDGDDWVFNGRPPTDPKTGKPLRELEPWEKEWVQLKDVPLFADDLAAAPAEADASAEG